MQQDRFTDPGTYDDGDDQSITDDGNLTYLHKDDCNDHSLELDKDNCINSEFDENDATYSHVSTDEDVELPEEWRTRLSQWASMVCLLCRRFLEGKVCLEQRGWHRNYSTYHSSMSSLRQSVQAGCPLCRQLSLSLNGFCTKAGLGTPSNSWVIKCSFSSRYNRFTYPEAKDLQLHFYLFDSEGRHLRTNYSYGFGNMTFCPAKALGGIGPEFFDCNSMTSTAKSAASIELVRYWYQQCTCRNWQPESRVLPTRLVQVWRPRQQGFPDICAKLCEAGSLPVSSTSYVTLSHRWGPNDFLKLQKSNHQAFREGIPVNQLLNVFRDALYIAAELKIHYVWIDSLCIIQDCEKDWTRESKRMGDVYQYGEFNIAATGYDHGAQSLFNTRDAVPSQQFPVYVDFHSRRKDAEHFEGYYIKVNERGFYEAVIDGPLNSRGWVAQEWALSPAVVHYTPKETWWDCSDIIACETFMTGSENWDPSEIYKHRRIRALSDDNKEPIYRFWRQFVELYVRTKTTFEKDRFPAAAGIARILGNMLHEGFIAGIWEGDIVRSLVWECLDNVSIPSAPLAPSWSWASVCGRIGNWGFEPNSSAQQLSCISIEVLSDIDGFTSDLEAASLEKSSVRALAVRGPLRTLPQDLSVPVGAGTNGLNYVHVAEDRDHIIPGFQDGSIPDEQAWHLKGSTHLLPLAKDDESVFGLLLQHVPEAQDPNTFHRSGKVHFYFNTIKVAEEYLGISQKDGKYQPSWRFRECGVQDVILI